MAVTSQVQQVSGIRISLMPLQRRSTMVAMKLMAPISDAPQKMAMLTIQRVWPKPSPGPVTGPAPLSGGYAVQPERGAPPCTKKAATITTSARKVVQKDIMFSTGNAMSSAPIWIGRIKLPKPLCGTVVSTKKTMMVPCMVISERYSSGVITPPAAALGHRLAKNATLASGCTMWKATFL